MPRNLDLTALRAFVTVAETGGVTRAAGQLNLTQSAVSMQLKRLEEALGQGLLDRTGRSVAPTPAGEQLLSYGRRILALNDEIWARMRDDAFEGEVRLGVPSDVVYPHIPTVLRRFAAEYPRVRVELTSSYTRRLKGAFLRGELDLILTTEQGCEAKGETLQHQALLWVGAPGGTAWRGRPLKLAFERMCLFRPYVTDALDAAGIPWDMAVSSDSTRTVDATVSADLAVHANINGNASPWLEVIEHGGALPDLGGVNINLYAAPRRDLPPLDALIRFIREAYGVSAAPAMAVPAAAE